MGADLRCYGRFVAQEGGIGLPATPERLSRWIDDLEDRGQRPATVTRKIASLAAVHKITGEPSVSSAPLVKDSLSGMRRREGTAQRRAGGLRLGDPIGPAAVKGFSIKTLLDACDSDPAGLRDAALLSLGYDAGLRVSELMAVRAEHLSLEEDGCGQLELPRSKTDQEGQGAYAFVSPDTMRRIEAWCEVASIKSGPLFRRIVVRRTKAIAPRRALRHSDLAPNQAVDPDRMKARSGRQASTTFTIGKNALTRAAIAMIIKKRARLALDYGTVDLCGENEEKAIAALSTHSLRVGLTQDLFANGEDAGSIAQALRWSSPNTAIRYGRKLAPQSNAAARLLAKRRS
ncbi:MAG: tyrosine-type recombinase/integrase [Pseudomonadota bacterium]